MSQTKGSARVGTASLNHNSEWCFYQPSAGIDEGAELDGCTQQIPRFGQGTNFHGKYRTAHPPSMYSRKQVSFVSSNCCIHSNDSKFADNTNNTCGAVDTLEGEGVSHGTLTGLRGGSV